MCLLTFLPSNVMPDVESLLNGSIVNDDGHGYAIVSGRDLIIGRSLDGVSLIESFAVERARHPDGPALFHSRFGTHGTNDVINCHPFFVGGDKRTIIAHNGILPKAVHPAKDDWRSDTRIAAEDLIPQLGNLRHRRTRLLLERWMTPANKMIILSVDRRFRDNSYILNEQEGIWDGGVWYSNSGYQPFKRDQWDYPGSWGPRWEPPRECSRCHMPTLWCDCECLDCGMESGDCLCYVPARRIWSGTGDIRPGLINTIG